MPITYINTGTSPNAGNGDVLRLAFQKVNSNFQYLNTLTVLSITNQQLFTSSNVTFNGMTATNIFAGSVYAADVTATNFIASKFYAPFGGPNIGGYAFFETGNDTGMFGPSDDVVDIMARGQTIVRFFATPAPAPASDSIFVVPYGSVVPVDDLLCSLGNSGRYWTELFVSTATVNRIVFPDGSIQTTTNTSFNQSIIPSLDLTYDLGSTSSQWRSLYVGTSTIYIGGTALSVENGNLTLGGNTLQISSLTNSSSYLTIGPDDTVDFSGGLKFFSDGYNGTLMHESTFDSALAMMSHGNEISSYVGMVWNREYTDVYVGTETSTWIWVDPSGAHVGCYVLNTSTYQIDVKLWQFNYNGDLIFPDGTIQNTAVNRQILGPLGQYAPSGITGRNRTFYAGSTGTFTASEVAGIDAGWYVFGFGLFNTVVQSVVIEDSFAYITINDGIFQPYQDYTFSTSSGTVTAIPGNSQGYLYNDGTGTLTWSVIGAGSGLGDRITSSTYNVILEGTTGTLSIPGTIISQGYELGLAGSDYSYSVGRYLRVRDGDFESHLHLDTPDNSLYDIILGNDSKFVRVDHTGPVVIGTNGVSSHSWSFGTDGLLTLPSGNITIGNFFGNDAILCSTGTAFGILSQGSGSSILQWLDDTNNPTVIAGIAVNSPYSNTGSVQIFTGVVGVPPQYGWSFGADGNLSFPDGTTSTGAAVYVPYATSSSFKIATEVDILGSYLPLTFEVIGDRIKLPNGNGLIQSGDNHLEPWSLDSLNKSFTFPNNSDIEYGDGTYLSTGSLRVRVDSGGEFSIFLGEPNKTWTFGNDGNLTFPSGSGITFDSSATSTITGVSSVIFADGTEQNTAYKIINDIPLSSTSTGIRGQIATTGTDIYICVDTNSWLKVTGVTF